MPTRRETRDLRQHDQRVSRVENGHLKRKERARREARMKELLAKGTYPYTPTIMSWLSAHLDKPSHRITAEDAKNASK